MAFQTFSNTGAVLIDTSSTLGRLFFYSAVSVAPTGSADISVPGMVGSDDIFCSSNSDPDYEVFRSGTTISIRRFGSNGTITILIVVLRFT